MALTTTHSVASIRGWAQSMTGPWGMQQNINASDAFSNDYFGYSVSTNSDGTYMIIGAPGADIGVQFSAGAAYIFTRTGSTWTQQQKITASDGLTNDNFGWSVDINDDGTYIVVGTNFDDISGRIDQGSAYIFTRTGSTWTQQQKITASDGLEQDRFGTSVSMNTDGTKVVIGSPFANIGLVNNQGAAYIFTRTGSTWTQQQKITASDGVANDHFGESVSISKNGLVIIAGAIGASINQGGAAYIFEYNGSSWIQRRILTASDSAIGDDFGKSVDINYNGTMTIVGNWIDTIGSNTNQGSAYIFTGSGSTWTQQQKLIATDGTANDNFGISVSLSANSNVAIIGAFRDDPDGRNDGGSAYIFSSNGSTWTQQQKLIATDGIAEDRFGVSVSINNTGNTVIVGADQLNIISAPGKAYIYTSN